MHGGNTQPAAWSTNPTIRSAKSLSSGFPPESKSGTPGTEFMPQTQAADTYPNDSTPRRDYG